MHVQSCFFAYSTYCFFWRSRWRRRRGILNSLVLKPVANPRERPGGPPSPLFLDQTEVRRAEKIFFETGRPPYLKVWIRHWKLSISLHFFQVG